MPATVTANVVSRFLGLRGFSRSTSTTTRVRGWLRWTEGYEVRPALNGTVRIDWNMSTGFRSGDPDERSARIAAMEEALKERYTVVRERPGTSDREVLIVSQKTV